MPKRVKYRKSMRVLRKKVADLLRGARAAIRSGRCLRASALYNEALGFAHRGGVRMKGPTAYRMKSELRRCRREYGWNRA